MVDSSPSPNGERGKALFTGVMVALLERESVFDAAELFSRSIGVTSGLPLLVIGLLSSTTISCFSSFS